MFYNLDTLDADSTTRVRKDKDNSKYSNYMLGGYGPASLGTSKSSHMQFALQQPGVLYYGLNNGNGLHGDIIDFETELKDKKKSRPAPADKLQLFQRPFVTVPFIGRGRGDPTIESQLLQGEQTYDARSVSNVMESSTLKYLPPVNSGMYNNVNNSSFVQESALNGWVRGGDQTRKN